MTAGASPNDLAALVLAFYREPLSRQALLRERMESPGQAQRLLRAAAGLDGASDELRQAAAFAVEQLFFAPGASHYRVMGLCPDATEQQIKSHHRLLMRLLHPDRSASRASWLDAYAGRVNEAYNVLRKSQTRRVYDGSLASGQRGWSPHGSEAHLSARASVGPFGRLRPAPFQRYRSALFRYLPQFVLAGTALLALLFVSWVYLASSPRPALIRGDGDLPPPQGLSLSASAAEQAPLAPVAEREQRLARQREARKQEVQLILARVAVKRDGGRVDGRRTGEGAMENRAALAIAASADTPANRERALRLRRDEQRREIGALLEWGKSTRARQLWNQSIAQLEHQPPQTEFDLRPDPGQSSPPRAATDKARRRPEPQAAPQRESSREYSLTRPAPLRNISQSDLNWLLDRFIETYNRGDLDSFMALFAQRARMDEISGKQAIRVDYQQIFGDTLSRRLAIGLLDWQVVGAHAFGTGRYHVRVQRRGQSAAENYAGVIRFEIRKRQGQVRITRLSHDVR